MAAMMHGREPSWRPILVRTAAGLVLVLVLLVALFFSLWLLDPRLRTYNSLYRTLRVGMTRAEVFDALRRSYPPGGKRQTPRIWHDTEGGIGFHMNPEGQGREPNCEAIIVHLENGRVTGKGYNPD